MPKQDFGTKLECPECSVKFYDLHKNPAHCPSCAHEFDPIAWLEERFGQTHPDVEAANDAQSQQDSQTDDDDLEEEEDDIAEIDVEAEKVPSAGNDEDEDLESDEVPIIGDDGVEVDKENLDDEEADDDVTVLDDGSEFSESELGVFESNKDELEE